MIKEQLIRSDLENGLRWIHTPTDSHVGHIALFINAGTRDEDASEHGLAHFIEHALFKGTTNRKAFHILSRMEDVGGEINAYTNKEETCIHASFLNEHFDRAIELIADIVFNSTFPEKELEREKTVIRDEITSYQDSPSEQIFDDFDELIFGDHELGRNVLGTEKSVSGLTRSDVSAFVDRHYVSSNMVLSTTSNLQPAKLSKLVRKHFDRSSPSPFTDSRNRFERPVHFSEIKKREVFQAHLIFGGKGYSFSDEKRMGLALLTNLLGGPGMNARLSMSLRERHGYSYNVESNYAIYSDAGLFTVYIGCDEKHVDRCADLAHKELKLLMNKPLGTVQLQKTKQQVLGQMALSAESGLSQVIGNGKALIATDHVRTFDEVAKDVNDLTADQLQEIAQEIFSRNQLSTLIYKK